MKRNNINVHKVSNLIGNMYLKMIFGKGFVHCDPHQGKSIIDER
jgi:predicted unusual protein kinase regulating ubiquinone biosynthesis (AarF/ABC1/UbiB family)